MNFDRMTWIGLIIVALGWTLLLSTPQLADYWASVSGRPVSSTSSDMAGIAQSTILSGFGLAILGALQTGFGALKSFFDAALARTSHTPVKAVGQRPPHARKIAERGWVKDRAYVLFNDGSVEVETMLGRRLFASLQDAREFIA